MTRPRHRQNASLALAQKDRKHRPANQPVGAFLHFVGHKTALFRIIDVTLQVPTTNQITRIRGS